MMKKRLRVTAWLSALLCLCVLLVSCQSDRADSDAPVTEPVGGRPQDTDVEAEEEEEEPVPQNEVIDYQAIVGEWSRYLAYRSPERSTADTVTELYRAVEGQTEIREYGILHWVSDPNAEGVYNVKKGIPILTVDRTSDTERYELSVYECIVEEKRSVRTADPSLSDGELWVDTYDYYDSDGNLLNEAPLTERISVSVSPCEDPAYCFVRILDRCYLTRAGEILRVFEAGQERWIPEIHEEYMGYGYIFEDSSIRIVDEDGRELAYDRQSAAADSARTAILSNGDVLVAYCIVCPDDAADYDAKTANGDKLKIFYEVIDVSTGETERISASFWIGSLVTPSEGSGTNLTVKGDYQFAEVYKITDRKLSEEPTFVILDPRLEIVSELPPILKNQNGVVCAINERTLIIRTATDWYYSVDLLNCTLSLYVNGATCQRTNEGWIRDGRLYNDRMELLADLEEYERYAVIGDRVAVLERPSDGNGEAAVWKALYVEEGALKSFAFNGTDQPSYDEERGLYWETYYDSVKGMTYTAYYGENGSLLFRGTDVTWLDLGEGAYLVRCVTGSTVGYYTVRS